MLSPHTTAATARPVPATRSGDRTLRNVVAFEAGLGRLRAAYPGLRHERVGTRIEWFLRASRPLAAEGLALKGELSVDIPLDEDTAEILDTMAYANDPRLGRVELDAALAEEARFLKGKLDHAIEALHRAIRKDLDVGGLDARAYLAAVGRALNGRTVELFPAGSERVGSRYRPGRHLRETVETAAAAARKTSRPAPRRQKPQRPVPTRPARGRAVRMRRWSPLYE